MPDLRGGFLPDLRRVHPGDGTVQALLRNANLRPGEYLVAIWEKKSGGTVRAKITPGIAAKVAYIRQMMQAHGCTKLRFVVTLPVKDYPDHDINPQGENGATLTYLFGA